MTKERTQEHNTEVATAHASLMAPFPDHIRTRERERERYIGAQRHRVTMPSLLN